MKCDHSNSVGKKFLPISLHQGSHVFINLVGYIPSRSYENRTHWKVYARQLNLT